MDKQIDDLLQGAEPEPIQDGLGDRFKKNKGNTDLRNVFTDKAREAKLSSDPHGLDFNTKNLNADQLGGALGLDQFTPEPAIDRVKDASDNAVNTGKILNAETGQYEDFNKEDWTTSLFSGFGYNNFLYSKKVDNFTGREAAIDQMTAGNPLAGNLAKQFTEKFDDEQKYDFLVPTVDPNTGKNILTRIRSTYKEAAKNGYNVLNKFGASDKQDNAISSALIGFANTAGQTDDLVITAAKYVQDAALFVGDIFTPGDLDVKTKLDEVYEDTINDTHFNDFLPSDKSQEFGSIDWLANGAGSTYASLLQFGYMGRGIRGGVALANLGKMALGGQAIKQAFASKVASMGASGVMGFGYGYKEALQNGLKGGDALLYGAVVGSINTAIEMKLGKAFDNYLTGGGPKVISKEILASMDNRVTQEGVAGFMKNNASKLVNSMGDRFSNMASEGTEEILQDVVEQGSKLAYNALFAGDKTEKGNGQFDIHEYDFMQTVSAGIFGAVGAAPFNSSGNKMAQRIYNGEGDQVKVAIENLRSEEKISETQYNALKTQAENIQESYDLNKNLINGLSGEFADQIKLEALQLVTKRSALQENIKKIQDNLDTNNVEDAVKAKENIEAIQKHVDQLSIAINKYGDENFLAERNKTLQEAKQSKQESQDNIFGQIAHAVNYTVDKSAEDTAKRLGTLTADMYQSTPIARTSDEAAYVTSMIASGNIDASMIPAFKKQMEFLKFNLSPKVNTMENRETLLGMGFKEEDLPLTPEEKLDAVQNPQKYATRFISPDELGLAEMTAPGETRIDRVTHILANAKSFGLNDAKIGSLDNRAILSEVLAPEQLKAITKVLDSTFPVSIILTGGNEDAKGSFGDGRRFMVIDGVLNKLKAAKTEKEKTALRNNLFHVLTHEAGHALFNRDLSKMHSDWAQRFNPKAPLSHASELNAIYFDRIFNLARVSFEALHKEAGAKNLYFFNTIAPQFNSLGTAEEKIPAALTFVQEFFAEAMSNEKFQTILDSFDINDAKNSGILNQFNYKYVRPVVAKKESLLAQAIKAVGSVFTRMKNILDRNDRTILTEAMGLASLTDFNRFTESTSELSVKTRVSALGISNYNGVNIFEGEQVGKEELVALLYRRLEKAGVSLNEIQQRELLDRVSNFANNEMTGEGKPKLLDGSVVVVYFKATDNFMIMWKNVSEDGDQVNRAFFNKYGRKMLINTDVDNLTSATTLSKPDGFAAFGGDKGEENTNKRAVLNNVDRAVREGLTGAAHLELDNKHSWKFNGKNIAGQINIVYTFQDGTEGVIGYAPDLAKVRLAHMLSNGAKIHVLMQRSSDGSSAYVKRNEKGELVEVYKTNDRNIDPRNYSKENVFPSMSFTYSEGSKVSPEAQAVANAVDTLTPDNRNLEPKISNKDLLTGSDILLQGYFSGIKFKGFSMYAPNVGSSPTDQHVEYAREGMGRFIKRAMYFMDRQDVTNDEVYQLAAEYIQNHASPYLITSAGLPEAAAANLGFETAEEFVSFADVAIEEALRESKIKGNIAKEDWFGLGGNPSGRISEGIKADIEALSYVDGNTKKWIDFGDAKDIMREAAKRARTFSDIVEGLENNLNSKIYAGARKSIAESILKHLKTAQDLDPVKNSYTSQFKSFIRLDAITFSPNGESSRVFFNGERANLDSGRNEIASRFQSKAGEIIDQLTAIGTPVTAEAVMTELGNQLNAFHVDRQILKDEQKGVIGGNRASHEASITTQDGKPSNVIRLLGSFYTSYCKADKQSAFNLKGFHEDGIMAAGLSNKNSGKGLAAYQKAARMLDSYYAFFGIELPEAVLELKRNDRNIAYLREAKQKLIAEGLEPASADRSIRDAMKLTEINDYYMVTYKPAGAEAAQARPFVQFATHMANYMNLEIQKQVAGKEFDYKINETNVMAKTLQQLDGSYRSPEFYFNANNQKEWAVKIKSYTDSLIEDLNDEDSDVLKKYLKTDAYKNNRFLQFLKKLNGQEAAQFMISGIKSFDNDAVAKDYTSSGDLDYLYMNLSGFVHNYESDRYYHVDDVPSDKPRQMAFTMPRVNNQDFKNEIQKIIDTETARTKRENARFDEAFDATDEKVDGKTLYRVTGKAAFESLIPKVHYGAGVEVNGEMLYPAGWMFDRKNFFYEGKKADEIARMIEGETRQSYVDLKTQEMNFPVPASFIKSLKEKNLPEKEHRMALAAEQERVFGQWRQNYIINRYHLNQVLMGDYMYYKQDGFADLNKRHAGTAAPSQKGVFKTEKLKAVLISDVKPLGEVNLPRLVQRDGKWVMDDSINLADGINRTDAQGYVTEQFAKEIGEAFGSMSGYEKIFKPVVYGVNKDEIENAQPIYMKLSLAVLPDPGTDENPLNEDYYNNYPQQRDFAKKVYGSTAQFAVFDSGIKVGLTHLNNFSDGEYKTYEFDSDLFGLQNNPYHDPNTDDNTISGMVQQTKQLGDNGNYEGVMSIYHEIEGKMVDREVADFLKIKMESQASIRKIIKDRLAESEHSSPIAAFIDDDIRVLDVPQTSRFAENMMNAQYRNEISLFDKAGEKLVNVSDLGFQRPTNVDLGLRSVLLSKYGIEGTEYNSELQWAGPRMLQDLTVGQLSEIDSRIDAKTASVNNDGYVLDESGELMIFPTEVIVPEGPNYQIGDRLIATRIPTSKKSSSIPSVVVGFSKQSQGNIIVTPKHGTAVLGFDFDVDGLFVWRENSGRANKSMEKMFDIAYGVLTNVKNYNELVSPTITDNVKDVANEIDKLKAERSKEDKIKYSKFSPERQLELKRLNSIGKIMIGVGAYAYGIHSVFEQNLGTPFISTNRNHRAYNIPNGGNKFVSVLINEDGTTTLTTDVYSEFINAAADNAKLQLLGRINANPTTAGVLFDMISHGASLKYATYFINQPVILEYVKLKEIRGASSFIGERKSVEATLVDTLEAKIRALGGKYSNYKFDARDANGFSIEGSKAIARKHADDFGNLTQTKMDKILLTAEDLKDGIRGKVDAGFANPTDARFANLERQLIVLDKFLFYRQLSQISADAGKLPMLTSGYPKTFIEILNTRNKISDASDKIRISSLMNNHGFYKIHWSRMSDLLTKYGQFKLYANPAVQALHDEIVGGKAIKLQQKAHDDFYTSILANESESDNENGVYNMSTSSLTGEQIDPYHFVNQSAILIDQMKKAFPDNAFLRTLSVKINNTALTASKAVKPSMATIDIGFDPDGDMLTKIHQAFLGLPTDYDFTYMETVDGSQVKVKTKIASVKDVVLGHLVHTQGFGLGGFNFSKLLPTQTVKFVNDAIQVIADRLESFETLAPAPFKGDFIGMTESPFEDEQLYKAELKKWSDKALADSGLALFAQQVRLNNPQIINEVKPEMLKAASISVNGHFWQWEERDNADVHFDGAVARVKTTDGGELVNIMVNKKNLENKNLVDKIAKEGYVRMKDMNGNIRIYKSNGTKKAEGKYTAGYLELETINFINYPNLKQYGQLTYTNELANAAIENIDLESLPEFMPMDLAEIKGNVLGGYKAMDAAMDLALVQDGVQTAALNTFDPQVGPGETIMFPAESGTVIATVKKVWGIDKMYERAVLREPETATAKVLAWASRLTGSPITSLEQILGHHLVEFNYNGTVNVDGFMSHAPVTQHEYADYDEGYDSQEGDTVSNYKPRKSENLYKSIMTKAGQYMKTVSNVMYDGSNPASFYAVLTANGMDAVQKHIIADFIANNAITSATLDEISDALIAIGSSNASLENYNTAVGYDRFNATPLEKFHDVATAVFGPRFSEMAANFEQYMDSPMGSSEYNMNEETMQPYTYYEWLVKEYDRYIREEKLFEEIRNKYPENDFDGFGYAELLADYTTIVRDMNSADGLVRRENQEWIGKLGHRVGRLAEVNSFDIIQGVTGVVPGTEQNDILTWEEEIKSVTDFTERQAAMQEVGRSISDAQIKADKEQLSTEIRMNQLMRNMVAAHYQSKPKSFFDKFNFMTWGKQAHEAFDWMLETDAKGEYTGKMVARYASTDKKWRKIAFERVRNANGDAQYFAISNKKILKAINDIATTGRVFTTTELNRIADITQKYDSYDEFHDMYQTFTEAEMRQSGKDTSFIRNMWVKAHVRSEDSELFKEIKRAAAQGDKLAIAKIELYDFLDSRSNDLLQESGYMAQAYDRGLLPQTEADITETYRRYGFKEAYRKFKEKTQDDINTIEDEFGFVVAATPIVSFENSKKVPFRTLRNKENFSINVPAIFKHHFDSLIFKKHYDNVLPLMDAVKTYYTMKFKMGGERFDNIIKYIDDYANFKIFGKKTDFAKSSLGKGMGIVAQAVTFGALGFAPVSSMINLTVGQLETVKNMMGDYGFGDGWTKFNRGLKRLHGVNSKQVSIGGILGGSWVINPKATAIMNYYGIETFIQDALTSDPGALSQLTNASMVWQQNAEIMIRGTAFMAELTDAQWNAFTLKEDGTLEVGPDRPDDDQVAAWKNNIGSIQGKYDPEAKRMFHHNALLNALLQFKGGWMIDFMRARFGNHLYDQYGKEREGYYQTAYRLVAGRETNGERLHNYKRVIAQLKGKQSLTPIEAANMKKVAFDLIMWSSLYLVRMLAGGTGGDDDRSKTWYIKYLAKVNSSLMLGVDPRQWVEMLKRPFAFVGLLDNATKVVEGAIEIDADKDGEWHWGIDKSGKAAYKLMPGRQIVELGEQLVDTVSGEDE